MSADGAGDRAVGSCACGAFAAVVTGLAAALVASDLPAAGPQLVSTATSAASTAGALAAAAMFVYSRSWRDGEPPGRDEVDELRRRPPLDP